MPDQIRPSGRAKAAIAAVLSISTMIGGTWYVVKPGQKPIPAAIVLADQTLVQPWEGRALHAYYDRIAYPHRWTVCDGDTANVTPNMTETPAGCDARLQRRMADEFYPGLQECIDNFDKKPLSWQAMMISLAWNVGVRKACDSRAADFGNAGNYHASCVAATSFNRAGGRVIIGLKRRREMGDRTRIGEGEICESGI